MAQKIMLITYLIIGISIFTMCSKEDADLNTIINYKYINQSGHSLEIKGYNYLDSLIKEYSIANNDSIVESLESKGAGSSPFVYGSSDTQVIDSLLIIFNDTKFQYFVKDINDGPLARSNYENFGKIIDAKQEYTFVYRISEEDYNTAKDFK